jgi:hypothetical protein
MRERSSPLPATAPLCAGNGSHRIELGVQHRIGMGRALARTPVLKLVQDLNVRVIDAATGELLRGLTIDPNRDYQATDEPAAPRVRADRIDNDGKLTLRVNSRLHHIGIGRTHARTHVLKLVQDLNVRIINAGTGELPRELTIDPNRDYQPTGHPPRSARKTKKAKP